MRLGVVVSPEPEWGKYENRLAIPYLDRNGIYSFNFRCLRSHDCKKSECPKYLQPDGHELGFFNVLSLDSDAEVAHICEGEIDAITLAQVVDEPVLGLAGASKWAAHFPYHFSGFDRVVVWADGDQAGGNMWERIKKVVKNAELAQIPGGEDVNSLYCSKGAASLKSLYVDEEES